MSGGCGWTKKKPRRRVWHLGDGLLVKQQFQTQLTLFILYLVVFSISLVWRSLYEHRVR